MIARLLLSFNLLLAGCQARHLENMPFNVASLQGPAAVASVVWPVIAKLPAPQGLRPCCAFGYNVRAKVLGIPVPGFKIGNVIAPDDSGQHHYNDHLLSILSTLSGLNREHDGIIYTLRGGFIDLAHVRDTADNTLWLFSQIWPRLGQAFTVRLDDELGQRTIRLWPFTPPATALARYHLAVMMAAQLAYQLAVWHEVAQWYGFESVPGYSEAVSAFSPEDLYSNLLGARLASDLLNHGGASTLRQYQRTMAQAIPQALAQLEAVSPQQTRFHFDMLDGKWWNSRCRLPDKFLVRRRNYLTGALRYPTRPAERVPMLWLTLPDSFHGQPLSAFARLEIWPGNNMKQLPAPKSPRIFYRFADFATLAQQAKEVDRRRLLRIGQRCK